MGEKTFIIEKSFSKNKFLYNLNDLIKSQKEAEETLYICYKDGKIIGNGQSDFTKGNKEYYFTHNDKDFVLIDVPGIEGDESNYKSYIEKSIAKAHLILYVNGTNKKPERNTINKIKSYMKRNSKVYGICNPKGKADTYEDEEQQINIKTTHNDIDDVIEQTKIELSNSIGEEQIIDVDCVHGLMAFLSTAIDENNISTIDRTREKDLLKHQKRFIKNFGCVERIKDFSNINALVEMIMSKSATAEQDLIEENKIKIIKMLKDRLEKLESIKMNQSELFEDIKTELKSTKNRIKNNSKTSIDKIKRISKSEVNKQCIILEEKIHNEIKINHDNKEILQTNIEKISKKIEVNLKDNLSINIDNEVNNLNEDIEKQIKRMREDLVRVYYNNEVKNNISTDLSISKVMNNLNFSTKDIFGSSGSMIAFTSIGFYLGSFFPGIGNAIGAVVGAILGVIFNVINYLFVSKSRKIDKAIQKTSEEIDNIKESILKEVEKECDVIGANIRKEIENVENFLDEEIKKIDDMDKILSEIIKNFMNILQDLEERPYGAI